MVDFLSLFVCFFFLQKERRLRKQGTSWSRMTGRAPWWLCTFVMATKPPETLIRCASCFLFFSFLFFYFLF